MNSNFPELRHLRNLLEQQALYWKAENFPQGWCAHGASAVELTLGLPTMMGTYSEPGSLEYSGEGHFWNLDPTKKLIIDITADNFPNMPSIAIVKDDLICYKGTPANEQIMDRFCSSAKVCFLTYLELYLRTTTVPREVKEKISQIIANERHVRGTLVTLLT